jgi:hypothetical protein
VMARVTCDGQRHPFLWLRDGTHPLAVAPGNPGLLPRPGRSDRQRRWVPQKPGPGRQIVSQDNPNGVSRIGGQAGTQAPDPTPPPDQNRGSGAGSTTYTLPAESVLLAAALLKRAAAPRLSCYERPLPSAPGHGTEPGFRVRRKGVAAARGGLPGTGRPSAARGSGILVPAAGIFIAPCAGLLAGCRRAVAFCLAGGGVRCVR